MLTFDGKSASFIPGKENPNKEPAVSKFVVEKLYKVHRERVLNMEPVVESRIDIPDFLTDNSWKKITEQHRHEVIRRENEVIYQRIAKVENLESLITKASREHKYRVEKELVLMKNLKLKGRVRDFLKVQRENEDMLKRIERARPEYTLKGCKEWYKHHELFKQGRRSEPTAGHLGFKTVKGLLPKKMEPVMNSSLESTLNSIMFKENGVNGVHGGDPGKTGRGNTADGKRRNSTINKVNNSIARGVLGARTRARTAGGLHGNSGRGAAAQFSDYMDQNSMVDMAETLDLGAASQTSSQEGDGDSLYEQMVQIGVTTADAQRPKTQGGKLARNIGGRRGIGSAGASRGEDSSVAQSSQVRFSNGGSLEDVGSLTETKDQASDEQLPKAEAKESQEGSLGYASEVFEADGSIGSVGSAGQSLSSPSRLSLSDMMHKEGFQSLLRRPFTIPFGNTVMVQLLSSTTEYNAELLVRVTNGNGKETLAERFVPIDMVFEVVSNTNSNSMLQSAGNGDLASLRSLLLTMWKQADDDGNGYLTYDEFEGLMEHVELGISNSDLRYVIQEADENENGVVEFDEFVPLAVDLIQSFRSVNRAKIYCSQRDAMFIEEVQEKMQHIDVEGITNVCLAKLAESDPKKYGVMRVQEFRRCLNSIAYAADLTEGDISQIMHRLPVDAFGRVLYNTLGDVLVKVKFNALKTDLVREQGGELQKWLFDRCIKEEMSQQNEASLAAGQSEAFAGVGRIKSDTLASVLRDPKLNLSRLQVCVLLAGNVMDGDVDYHQFIPIAVKAIEYMFEPKALRQRAELIEKTDLSSENLMDALTHSLEELTGRVSGLFNACDVNHSGSLNLAEFVLVLNSLEFELTEEEIEAYFSLIPLSRQDGEITLTEIVKFLSENLPSLQRKKQNRKLVSELHSKHSANPDKESVKKEAEVLEGRLRDILTISDTENTGFLTREEFKVVLQNLDLSISNLEMDMILAEADRSDGDDDGLIDYIMFLPDCVKLLQTFIARENAMGENANQERMAYEKAEAIATASRSEIMQVAAYLRSRLTIIDTQLHFPAERRHAVSELVHNPHSGLTKTEGNALISWLFDDNDSADSELKSHHAHHQHHSHKNNDKKDDKGFEKEEKSAPAPAPNAEEKGPSPSKKEGGARVSVRVSNKSLMKTQAPASKTAKRAMKLSLKNVKENIQLKAKSLQRSLEELIEIVHAVRRNSIMRGILHELSPTACTNLILSHIEIIREDMIAAGLMEPLGIYVPVKCCYQALNNASELRLNRSQILSIVSWAECYDKTGQNLDYKQFAEGAAKVIVKLFDPDHLTNRANVLTMGDDCKKDEEESTIMSGLQEEDMIFYLKQTVHSLLVGESRELTQQQCTHILKEIPLLKLSDHEAAACVAACTGNDFTVNVDDLLADAYDLLRNICRERFVNRRVAIMTLSGTPGESSADKDALQEITALAEKFIDFIKVRQVKSSHNEEKAQHQIVLPTDLDLKESNALTAEELATDDSQMNQLEVTLVSDRRLTFPVIERPKAMVLVTDGSAGGAGAAAQAAQNQVAQKKTNKVISSVPETFTGMLKIVAVEKALAMDRDMIVTITADDGRVACALPEAIKLPMLCAIDKELAIEFTDGFISRFYVEMVDKNDQHPIIRVGNGTLGGDRDVNLHVVIGA